jgi:Zn-dependent M16 (insulinase) family peptidase
MAIQRQSDLLDNRVFAILEVLKMLGIMDEEIEKILAQKKISLTSVEDREIMLKIEEAKKAAGEQ